MTRKKLNHHRTKIGLRRKACEAILRDAIQCSEHKLDDNGKALLWDHLVVAATKLLHGPQGGECES